MLVGFVSFPSAVHNFRHSLKIILFSFSYFPLRNMKCVFIFVIFFFFFCLGFLFLVLRACTSWNFVSLGDLGFLMVECSYMLCECTLFFSREGTLSVCGEPMLFSHLNLLLLTVLLCFLNHFLLAAMVF